MRPFAINLQVLSCTQNFNRVEKFSFPRLLDSFGDKSFEKISVISKITFLTRPKVSYESAS